MPNGIEAAARLLLTELAVMGGPMDRVHLAQGWVETCQGATMTLFQALSLFTDFASLAPAPAAHLASDCSLLVAQLWVDALERRMQGMLATETEALHKANQALRETDKGRADFISAYSHELRTPLTAIAGACELLLDDFADELSGPQFEYITMINQSAFLIRQLIDDVLDFEKLEARRLELHLEPLCIEEVVHDVAMLVSPLLQDKRLVWKQDLSEGLPLVLGDAVRLRQILLNLVSNAIKFTPEGGVITLRAALEKSVGKRGTLVALSVSDSGIGIAPEHQKRIFERFRQVGDKSGQGTGLGLPIAKRLAELHGGRMTLKSALGEGATFTFTIPAVSDA
ncbi:MAG TPA: HAMP domain-containing sensor histidine kinase [Stenomitos sp.]